MHVSQVDPKELIVKNTSNAFSANDKSKLDKTQAKRLKMPKRNRSAYFLFSMDARVKLKSELQSHLSPLELQIKVSQLWKDLRKDEKKKYEVRAREEKIEYLIAINKFYSSLTPETIERAKIDRPKKPCSAYAHFVRDVKLSLKKENPKLIMQEILHIVGEKWKNISHLEKLKYEEKARIDKEQYMFTTRRGFQLPQQSLKINNQIYQNTVKPVNDFENNLEELSMEGQSLKKIKTEQFSVKSEDFNKIESSVLKKVKIEEERGSSTADSFFTLKTEPETENGLKNTYSIEQICKSESLVYKENLKYFDTINHAKIPVFDLPHNSGFNIDQNFDISAYQEKLREMMITNLSWIRLTQVNKDMQESIRRKIAEVQALQTQRLTLVKNILKVSNLGTF